MTELCIYQCDICGKTFDNEIDCYKHEMEHNVTKLKNAVVLMDDGGEILPLDDMYTAIERSYAIYVGCKDAADILWKLFDNEGYCRPIDDINAPIHYPAFFVWDQNNYCWLYLNTLEEKYNRFLELKATAENALLS